MTAAPSLVDLFVAPLNRAGIEYMVTGGLAAVVYGHPRLTLDIDLVIRLAAADARAFAALWPSAEFYVPPSEAIIAECAREEYGHFNLLHRSSGMRADVYLAGSDELQLWAVQHRVARQVGGEVVQFAPVEYVIAFKLRYYEAGGSDRHLRDVARMLEVSGSTVDRAVLDRWVERLHLEHAWSKALAHRGQE